MRELIRIVVVLAAVAALGIAAYIHVSPSLLLTWGMGALCLAWLVALVTLPWNLHFEAKRVLFEIARSRERGIAVVPDREAYAIRVRDRMLWVSIGAHVFSAILMAVIAWASGGTVGYYFAGFYLLSMVFRPGVEWYQYLAGRLRLIFGEVHYPRDDVVSLRGEVAGLTRTLGEQRHRIEALERGLAQQTQTAQQRDDALDHRVTAIARKFEETVDRLTDNQEIISGVKAFLRLVRQGDTTLRA